MAGTSGKRGTRGQRGLQGARGATGARGAIGATGARGATGPRGPSATREQILEAVRQEFTDLRQHLQTQIERTGQMQRQLDAIQALLTKALEHG